MTKLTVLLGLTAFIAIFRPNTFGQALAEPPKSWIDPNTSHRVIRLTSGPSLSFYFNVNAYTPDGKEMAYLSPAGIGVVNLIDFKTRIVVPGPTRGAVVGHKTPRIFYMRPNENALYATEIDTGETQKLADLPAGVSVETVNADETLAAGTRAYISPREFGTMDTHAHKVEMMAKRLAAHSPMDLLTVDLKTGQPKVLLQGTDWYNHLQFSPTDPTMLMYCHEGLGWRVDRVWTIRTDGSENTMIPDEPEQNRILEGELAGHEWWSPDGRIIYVDLHFMNNVVGFLASYNLETKKHIWYHYEQNENCIHFSLSPDGTTFCGDGNPVGHWIYLVHPERIPDNQTLGQDLIATGVLKFEPLCNLAAHNYQLEPNANYTPDGKYIVFRSNMFGQSYAFAVEVAKSGGP